MQSENNQAIDADRKMLHHATRLSTQMADTSSANRFNHFTQLIMGPKAFAIRSQASVPDNKLVCVCCAVRPILREPSG